MKRQHTYLSVTCFITEGSWNKRMFSVNSQWRRLSQGQLKPFQYWVLQWSLPYPIWQLSLRQQRLGSWPSLDVRWKARERTLTVDWLPLLSAIVYGNAGEITQVLWWPWKHTYRWPLLFFFSWFFSSPFNHNVINIYINLSQIISVTANG